MYSTRDCFLEFCRVTNCNRLAKKNTEDEQCMVSSNDKCIKTKKQFFRWLSDNNFKIVKSYNGENNE